MTPLERRVRAHVYGWLVGTGRAPDADTVAAALSSTASDVRVALERLAAAHALVLAPGSTDIWMAHPFSALPTDYPVTAGDRSYFANCAWDAAGILAMVGDGRCRTTCADCGDQLVFDVDGGDLVGAGVVHFAVPARRFWDDIAFT